MKPEPVPRGSIDLDLDQVRMVQAGLEGVTADAGKEEVVPAQGS